MPLYDVTYDADGLVAKVDVSKERSATECRRKLITIVDEHGNRSQPMMIGLEDLGIVRVVNSGE